MICNTLCSRFRQSILSFIDNIFNNGVRNLLGNGKRLINGIIAVISKSRFSISLKMTFAFRYIFSCIYSSFEILFPNIQPHTIDDVKRDISSRTSIVIVLFSVLSAHCVHLSRTFDVEIRDLIIVDVERVSHFHP